MGEAPATVIFALGATYDESKAPKGLHFGIIIGDADLKSNSDHH